MMIDTLERAAEHIFNGLTTAAKEYVLTDSYGRIELSRFVRNKLSLWYTSSLTENWRNNPDSRHIIKGIDCSEDHPDRVAAKIVTMILRKIRDEQAN